MDAPTFTMRPNLSDIIGMTLIWANVPFSYFIVDDTGNTFEVSVDGGGTFEEYTLPPGTYNSQSICEVINSSFGLDAVCFVE